MWNSCLITKCTLALLDSSKSTRRVDLALSLADFGPLAVVTHDFLIKFHHITFHWRHLCKPAKPNLIVSHENFLIQVKAETVDWLASKFGWLSNRATRCEGGRPISFLLLFIAAGKVTLRECLTYSVSVRLRQINVSD